MAYEAISVEKSGITTVIKLNRPEKLNAMNPQMLGEMGDAIAELRRDTSTRFVILTGAGRAFSAGADLSGRGDTPPDTAASAPEVARLSQMASHDLIRSYQNLEQITIAAVHGYCLGAGLVFVLESDFILAADDAVIGVPETNVGVFYTWGSSARLSRLVGPLWAKQMIMTCENITAEQALSIGLANQVVPKDKLMDTAWALVDKIATKSPLAIRLTKKLVNAYTEASRGDLYVIEPELVERIQMSGDPDKGAGAFMKKESPEFGSA